MIIARSPLWISLGGGGTDLPSYYERFGGFLVSAAIDKYIYITLHETFVADLIVKYSKLERVATAAELEQMTPAEQDAIFEASIVRDLTEVPEEFLERVRSRANDRITAEIERVRSDEDFTSRAKRLIERDKELLERLGK